MTKLYYDLTCSLGANCSAAFQIKRRGLRQVALPFDWTWFNTIDAIEKLTEGFKNNFINFMRRENLRKLEGEEYSPEHSDRWQYEDTYTKFRYYNHFYKVENEQEEINRVIALFRKRCNRLDSLLKNSKRVLFVLSTNKDIANNLVENLQKTIQGKYPNCEINIYFQVFNYENDETVNKPNLTIKKYKRKENNYDYTETNFEWNFLDNVALSSSCLDENILKCLIYNLIKIYKIKKGIAIQFFQKINTIFFCKFYIFGIRIQLIVGKNKNE